MVRRGTLHHLRYSGWMTDSGRREANRLWSLILAAGGSSRLGTPKQLLRLGAQPLVSRAVTAAEAVTPGRVLVVLGAHALKLRLLLRRRHAGVRTVTNPGWSAGMAGSLAVGLSALPERADAAVLLLSDQPGIDARALQRLVRAWRCRPARPAAARYAGRLGVPAVLPRPLWAQARRLSGDVGARQLLRQCSGRTRAVEMPEAAFDVDSAEDGKRLASRDFVSTRAGGDRCARSRS